MTPSFEAWHEAGHAVVAHWLGGDVEWVALEPDMDSEAGYGGRTAVRFAAASSRDADRRSAAVALAGPLVELIVRDEDIAEDPSVLAAWADDWNEAQGCFERLAPPRATNGDERETLLKAVAGEVRRLLADPTVWERVARVADMLDAHESLDRALFAEAVGD